MAKIWLIIFDGSIWRLKLKNITLFYILGKIKGLFLNSRYGKPESFLFLRTDLLKLHDLFTAFLGVKRPSSRIFNFFYFAQKKKNNKKLWNF